MNKVIVLGVEYDVDEEGIIQFFPKPKGDEPVAKRRTKRTKDLANKIKPNGVLLTPDEMAKILRIHRVTVLRLASERKIPSIKLGGQVRFNPETVLAKLEAQKRNQ